MNEEEFKRKKFIELRQEFYPIIHSKKRTLDDLIYIWDFFREHMTVVDLMIRQGRYAKSKYKDIKNREKTVKTMVDFFEPKKAKSRGRNAA